MLEVEEYKKIIKKQQEHIDELCAIIQSIKTHKSNRIAPFIARLIKERNELDVQRSDALDNFQRVNVEYEKCKILTERFAKRV